MRVETLPRSVSVGVMLRFPCAQVLAPLVACGLVAACNPDSGGTETDSATGTATGSTTSPSTGAPTTGAPTTGTASATGSTGDSGTAGDSEGMTTAGPSSSSSSGGPGTSTTGTTGQVTASTTDASTGGTSTTGDETSGGSSSTTGVIEPCQPGETMGMGDVENSYLWVANTDEGSVSKVNTLTLIEEARYRTGPNGGAEEPSRTAVSFDGRFVIVNNRGTGSSSMIAANLEDCVDANGNGKIETSQNKNDLLAWKTDECLRWNLQHPFNGDIGGGPRGVTWTPGTWDMNACAFKDPKAWIGYLPAQNNTAHMVRVDLNGKIEETVTIPNWVVGDTSWGPYGAALDKDKKVWFTGLRGELFRLNTDKNPTTFDRWNPPDYVQSYGMTVDPEGDPWFGGCGGPVSTFNPQNQTFTAVPGTDACYRGLAADHDGSVWVASNGPCGVAQIDYKTNTLIKFHSLNPCSIPVGVSVDLEGYVWVVDELGWAWKIDPMNVPAMKKVDIIGDHYTYSDMTGGQLKSVILPQ